MTRSNFNYVSIPFKPIMIFTVTLLKMCLYEQVNDRERESNENIGYSIYQHTVPKWKQSMIERERVMKILVIVSISIQFQNGSHKVV